MNTLFHRLKSGTFSVALATALLAGGGTIASVAFGTVPAAFADEAPSGPPADGGPHGHRMGQLLLSLNLTDAQKTQIRGIMADAHKQNGGITDRAQRRANMKAAMTKVDAVLTPAQRTELHAKMDAMHRHDTAPAK
jgi:protein CpxP